VVESDGNLGVLVFTATQDTANAIQAYLDENYPPDFV
jgi:hypothetical protein